MRHDLKRLVGRLLALVLLSIGTVGLGQTGAADNSARTSTIGAGSADALDPRNPAAKSPCQFDLVGKPRVDDHHRSITEHHDPALDIEHPYLRVEMRPHDFRAHMNFNAALQRLASDDATVHQIMSEVNHLVRPSSALRAPEIVNRVSALMATSI